ncbi:MAG: alkene reductase [Marmoricola sp.]
MSTLFEPVTVGELKLNNRIVMAPLTRMRAPGEVPNALMAEYYAQRASAGLIITEGTQISTEGQGYMDTPGIFTEEHADGWRLTTQAVHAAGGRIAAQIWHVGRVSHESFHGGEPPVSASALPYRNRTTVKGEDGTPTRVDCPTPRALTLEEIPRVVEDYRQATRIARAAGFDYVEIHAAHGYLLHQFQSASSNERTDAYGGSVENRARLTLEVLDAVIDEWDRDHVGIRFSPLGSFNGVEDPEGAEMGLYLASEFARREPAFIHLSEPDWAGGPAITDEYREQLRAAYPGVLIGAGAYTPEKAERLLAANLIDAVAFGRAFIANPDLPRRLEHGLELNEPDPSTFYGGGATGYTDYPVFN